MNLFFDTLLVRSHLLRVLLNFSYHLHFTLTLLSHRELLYFTINHDLFRIVANILDFVRSLLILKVIGLRVVRINYIGAYLIDFTRIEVSIVVKASL
jgi:hypothetical protein